MTRGVGVGEWLATLPEWIVALAAILTQLGDLWFLTLVVGTLYWLGPHTPRLGPAVDRERMATVLAILFLAIATTATLKGIFTLPRPPWFVAAPTSDLLPAWFDTGYAWLAGASGHGFPSGHAIAGTMGWVGLAWAVQVGSRRRRYAIAATVVGTICLARLVLGVHFLADVLAGAAVALAALAVVLGSRRWLTVGRGPVIALALAVAMSVVGIVIAELSTDAAGALGLPLGAAVAWAAAGPNALAVEGRRVARVTAILGVLVVLPPLAVAVAGPVPPIGTLVIGTLAGAAVIALPLVGAWVEEKTGVGP